MSNRRNNAIIPYIKNDVSLKNIKSVDNLIFLVSALLIAFYIANTVVNEYIIPIFVIFLFLVMLWLFLPSARNKSYSNLKSIKVMFIYLYNNRAIQDITVENSLYQKLFNKGVIEMKVVEPRKSKKVVIDERSYRASGLKKIDGNIAIDKNGVSYKVYQIDFIETMGVNRDTDNANVRSMTVTLQALVSPYKIAFIKTSKPLLQDTIKYFNERLNREENTMKKQLLNEGINHMHFYNNKTYLNTFIHIPLNDEEVFLNNARQFLSYEELDNGQLINYLDIVQNEGVQ